MFPVRWSNQSPKLPNKSVKKSQALLPKSYTKIFKLERKGILAIKLSGATIVTSTNKIRIVAIKRIILSILTFINFYGYFLWKVIKRINSCTNRQSSRKLTWFYNKCIWRVYYKMCMRTCRKPCTIHVTYNLSPIYIISYRNRSGRGHVCIHTDKTVCVFYREPISICIRSITYCHYPTVVGGDNVCSECGCDIYAIVKTSFSFIASRICAFSPLSMKTSIFLSH